MCFKGPSRTVRFCTCWPQRILIWACIQEIGHQSITGRDKLDAIYLEVWKWPVLIKTDLLEFCSFTEMGLFPQRDRNSPSEKESLLVFFGSRIQSPWNYLAWNNTNLFLYVSGGHDAAMGLPGLMSRYGHNRIIPFIEAYAFPNLV